MTYMSYRVNADLWTKLRDILASEYAFNLKSDGTPLKGVTLYGVRSPRIDELPTHPGRLEGDTLAKWDADRRAGAIGYVVWSYRTPIAWKTRDGWFINPDRYSVTTSKHMGRVRTALSQIAAS